MASFDFVICNNCKRETYQGFGHCIYCGYDVIGNLSRTPTAAGSAVAAGVDYDSGRYRIVKAKSLLPPFVIVGAIGVGVAAWMVSNATMVPDSVMIYYLKAFFLGGLVGALLFG
jgi:hypothetical protein